LRCAVVYSEERPVREVQVEAFAIGRRPVTVAQFAQFTEPFGGLIETPNINRIAERGLVYTNFPTTALWSASRSCLMTGRNHTTNVMKVITGSTSRFPP
jgi:formylglycine-generating enzyme required for sulfatase activity